MARLTCVGVIIFSVFGIIYSLSTGTLHCRGVKDEFAKISSQDLVPDLPTIDEGLSICSRGLTPRQATCCSKETEPVYAVASETYVMNNIRARNKFLKSVVTTHLQYYRETILELIQHTLNNTRAKLSEWYGIPTEEHRHIVNNLFLSFEDFLKSNHVLVEESVSKFFDNILPVIYKNVIHRDSKSWTPAHANCLMKHRSEITPQPFGKHPEEIAANLNNALGLSKSYLEALAVILETINNTDNLALENECKNAVVRLQYCSHCRGFIDVKPCNGFCLNVMRGCLSNMAELGSEWNNIITSIEGMVREMSDKSLGDAFKKLSIGITDAIFHAVTTERNFNKSVQDLCGITIDVSSAPFTPSVSVTSNVQTEVTGPLSIELMQATMNLIDAKGLYTNLADDICAEPAKFEQNPQSATCWNGTEISAYLRTPVELDILEQARNNPEVKVTLVQPDLRRLKEKLTTVNQILQTQMHKSERFRYRGSMISDDPIVLDFSGNDPKIGNVNIEGGTTLFDDEDLNGDYLSGSGSGTEDIDSTIDTSIKPDVDVVLDKGNGGKYDVNQGGELGQAPRTTPRPAPSSQPLDRNSSVHGSRASILVLFIALYVAHVATGRR